MSTARDDLGARGDPANNRHVSLSMHDRLAGTHVAFHDQRLGFFRGGLRDCRRLFLSNCWRVLAECRRIDWPAPGNDRREVRPDQPAVNILRAHNPDVAPREAVQEIAVFLESDVERRHVENDGPGDKEGWRAGEPTIERGEPVGERLNRLEDVGQKGLRSKLEGLSRAYMRVHRTSPLAFR